VRSDRGRRPAMHAHAHMTTHWRPRTRCCLSPHLLVVGIIAIVVAPLTRFRPPTRSLMRRQAHAHTHKHINITRKHNAHRHALPRTRTHMTSDIPSPSPFLQSRTCAYVYNLPRTSGVTYKHSALPGERQAEHIGLESGWCPAGHSSRQNNLALPIAAAAAVAAAAAWA
jgi:hypothetical protein